MAGGKTLPYTDKDLEKGKESGSGHTQQKQQGTKLSHLLWAVYAINMAIGTLNVACWQWGLAQLQNSLEGVVQSAHLADGNETGDFRERILREVTGGITLFVTDLRYKTIIIFVISVLISLAVMESLTFMIIRLIDDIKSLMASASKLNFSQHVYDASNGQSYPALSDRAAISIREVSEMHESLSYMANGLLSFTKYMDSSIVHAMVKSNRVSQLGVAPADVTIFFSDLANFTALAETLPSWQFMEILGVYLDEMCKIIMNSGGVVGEFIGDGIMAWWNDPLEQDEFHTAVAFRAALAQQKKLEELRTEWCEKGLPSVRARMGLVRGQVLAGNIGSEQRMKYGLVGDRVNLASRLEGLCKTYGVSILVDGETREAAGVESEFYFRAVDLVTVKGRTSQTELLELVGCRSAVAGTPLSKEYDDFCNSFEAIHARYRVRDFEGANTALDTFLQRWPTDKPAQLLKERCSSLLTSLPGDSWTPVVSLDHK